MSRVGDCLNACGSGILTSAISQNQKKRLQQISKFFDQNIDQKCLLISEKEPKVIP